MHVCVNVCVCRLCRVVCVRLRLVVLCVYVSKSSDVYSVDPPEPKPMADCRPVRTNTCIGLKAPGGGWFGGHPDKSVDVCGIIYILVHDFITVTVTFVCTSCQIDRTA
jgi:hypothetical protein